MTYPYRAFLRDEFELDAVRLLIVEDVGIGQRRFLMANGTWQTVDDAVLPAGDFGILFRRDAVDAVLEALKHYKGDLLDSTTESKVLREALAVERARVDKVIGASVKS